MEAAEAHFERAWKRFGEAEMLIPEADRGKPMKPVQARPAAERRPQQTQIPYTLSLHALTVTCGDGNRAGGSSARMTGMPRSSLPGIASQARTAALTR